MKISWSDFAKIPHDQCNGIFQLENWAIYYYVNGKVHRDDGPAIENINGNKYWYINNKLHRLDGPAYESFNGYVEYYIEGKEYSKNEFELAANMYYLHKNGLQDYL